MDKYYKRVFEYGKSYSKVWFSSKLNRAIFKPQRIELSLPARCNLRCKMCIPAEDREKVRSGENLDLSSIKRIIDEMSEWRIQELDISGFGETLLNDNFFDIVSYASKRMIHSYTVTNGTLLNEGMCRKIIESGLFGLFVSLDGATSETHDDMRGVKGAFNKTINGIKTMNDVKNDLNKDFGSTGIITTITSLNFHELTEIVLLAKDLGFERVLFQPVHIEELIFKSPTNYHVIHNRNYEKSDLWIDKKDLDKFDRMVDELIKMRVHGENVISNQISSLEMIKEYFRDPRNLKFRCMAGYNSMGIGPQGNVYPCWLFESLGNNNIRQKSLKEIWFSDEFNKAREKMKRCSNKCLMGCHYLPEIKDLCSLLMKKISNQHR